MTAKQQDYKALFAADHGHCAPARGESCRMRLSVCLGVAALLVGSRALEVLEDASVAEAVDNNLLEPETHDKSLQDLCSAKKPVTCIKMVLVRGLERLSKWPPNMDLFPGLTVGGDFSSLQDLPREVTSSQPDDALLRGLTRYLSSMSLTVRVLDQSFVQRIQELGEQMTQQPEDAATGRKRRVGSALALAGLMSGGTLLALGMAAIAAMAGKAMMAALLSLMMSAMSSMRGGGDKGGSSYEVIHAHEHKHRSLDEAGDSSFAYPNFALPPSVAYQRSTLVPFIRRRK